MGTATEPIAIETRQDFETALDEKGVVLVDFYADWCGPCKRMNPVLEEIAEETAATLAKVDVDSQQELAQEHEVRSVPTIKVFADGKEVERLVGVQKKEQLVKIIKKYNET